MKLNRKIWLEKMEEKGIADDVFFILYGKKYTPRDIVKNKLFWLQVVKSV